MFRISIKFCNWTNKFYRFYASTSNPKTVLALTKADKDRFENLFPRVVSDLTTNSDFRLQKVMCHYKNALEFNVPHGKQQRGLLTVAAYKMLMGKATEEQLLQASLMGWCLEICQASMLIADDIMDNSETRRGHPCWYRREDVRLPKAVNDIVLVENGIYQLLKLLFSKESYYIDVVELFHQAISCTVWGQYLDLQSSKQEKELFTPTDENYNTIVEYKTSFYSYYAPTALAMYMVGIRDQLVHQDAKKILVKIGRLFQIQDDYLDCFGNPNETGKVGRDIEEGKCTWFIVEALKKLNEKESLKLKSWYGKDDPEFTKLVFDKYVELRLNEWYELYQKEEINRITKDIEEMSCHVPREIFHYCLQALFQRQK